MTISWGDGTADTPLDVSGDTDVWSSPIQSHTYGADGSYTVTVTGPDGGTDTLTVDVAAPPPTVASIAPTSGPAAGGTAVTITGTNFTGATGASVGGVPLTGFTVVSATRITGTTGAGTAGPADVVVGSATLTGGYTYT